MDNDSEQIEEIHAKLRLGKLDSLFLFIPTLVGIVFSLSQFYLRTVREETIVAFFIPILLIIVAIPIYVGYYRGGIALDSIVERARGWIYLANGFLIYLLVMITWYLRHQSQLVLLMTFLAGLFVGSINMLLARRIGCKILNLFAHSPSKHDRRRFIETGFATAFLAILSAVITANQENIPQVLSYPKVFESSIFLSLPGFFLFLLFETLAGEYVRPAKGPDFYLLCVLFGGVMPIIFQMLGSYFTNFFRILFILSVMSITGTIAFASIGLKTGLFEAKGNNLSHFAGA